MIDSVRAQTRPAAALELAFVMVIAWSALAALPWLRGGIGISWDALNHQIYLGWNADALRFHLDVLGASSQSYQYPYLYWPLYKLALGGASGVQAGLALVTLQIICVPPLWMISRSCIPDAGWFGTSMRLLAVAGAFASGLVLTFFDSTANDLLAATPLLWALALSFPYAAKRHAWPATAWALVVSGMLAGMSVAFKFSNGPLVFVLPVLWWFCGGTARQRMKGVFVGCVAILAGFAVAYGYWGWQLWMQHGNPLYPFGDAWFAPVRSLSGWTP